MLEELASRAIAIDCFLLLLDGIKGKAFWAILASSVVFTVPHVISKSPGMLQGIFTASLIMGYVYYKSRSLLLPAWIHAVANAGYLGGLLAAGAYCLIGLADLANSAAGCRHRGEPCGLLVNIDHDLVELRDHRRRPGDPQALDRAPRDARV